MRAESTESAITPKNIASAAAPKRVRAITKSFAPAEFATSDSATPPKNAEIAL